jgi:hypothetical protein
VGPKTNQIPVVFIEPVEKIKDEKAFVRELHELAKTSPLTADIAHIFIEPSFPVDIRHNSKIFREKLAVKAKSLLKL